MITTPRILLLYTGGTIGMRRDPETGYLIPFNFNNLLQQIPELGMLNCTIDTDSLDDPIDSSNMKPEIWVRLAERIKQDYNAYDGFVILHGSDTMAYTASALSFLLENLSKPVILTGSQLPIGIPRSDAKENLITTVEVAAAKNADGSAKVPEVCVYFEYKLYRGNRTHKISTEAFEAFDSLNYPALAQAGVNLRYNTLMVHRPNGKKLQVHTSVDARVGVATLFPGMTQDYINCIFNNPGLKAVIIRTFGSGNAPMDEWFIKLIQQVGARGLYMINVSQCLGGAVAQDKYESGKALHEAGVISGHDITFESALTKCMFLLGQNLTPEQFRIQFTTNLRGELS